ncbi:hypothetical protein G7046_g6075 [Stylonectria norvegica]|nr:hypothetical protein G7046_g6075 [Stylonectria norvegica]
MSTGDYRSTYQQYKLDTNAIASWLAVTAKGRGYKKLSEPSTSSDNVRKTTIAINDFLPLANFIKGQGKAVSIPRYLCHILNRVIKLRSDIAKSRVDKGLDADEGHAHFLGILEKVRESLKPQMPPSEKASIPVDKPAKGDTPAKGATPAKGDTPAKKSDRQSLFAALDVYLPSQGFLDAPPVKLPPAADKNITYEAEQFSSFEDAIVAYAMMIRNLDGLRTASRKVWENCLVGNLDISCTAILTATYLRMMYAIIAENLELLKPHNAEKVAQHMFLREAGVSLKDIDDAKIENLVRETGSKTQDLFGKTFLKSSYMAKQVRQEYPHLFNQTRDAYKKNDSKETIPAIEYRNLAEEEKDEYDYQRIVDFLHEVSAFYQAEPLIDWKRDGKTHVDGGNAVVQHILCDILPEQRLCFSVALQIFLDIHRVFNGGVGNVYEAVAHELKDLRTDIAEQIELIDEVEKPDRDPRREQRRKDLEKKDRMLEFHQEDPIYYMKSKDHGFDSNDHHSCRVHHLRLQSPMLSGLLLFYHQALHEELSLLMANEWGTIQCTVLLVNSLRVLDKKGQRVTASTPDDKKLFTAEWEDLKALNSLVEDTCFTVGGRLNAGTFMEDLYKHFCLSVGIPMNEVLGKTRAGASSSDPVADETHSNKNRRLMELKTPITKHFYDRYVNLQNRSTWTPELLHEIIIDAPYGEDLSMDGDRPCVELVRNPPKGSPKTTKKKKKKNAVVIKDPVPGPASLAASLGVRLQGELNARVFPYMKLTRSTHKVMAAIDRKVKPLLQRVHGGRIAKQSPNDFNFPFQLCMDIFLSGKNPLGLQIFQGVAEAIEEELASGEGDAATRFQFIKFDNPSYNL